jgi:integrase
MPPRRKLTPSYLEHKQSGRARAVWTDATGLRNFRMLPGQFGSVESRTAFAQLELGLAAAPHLTPGEAGEAVSVNEVMLAHLDHAEQHYRRADGTQTHEVEEYRLISRYVREVYGETPAAEFGPLALKAVRQKFIDANWCRSLINQRIGRVRRVFKWAASEELLPVAVHQALATVQGLQPGRSKVRESAPVEPVADAVVDAVLPFLNRYVRGLVEFQRLTGCRPGEACTIRRRDIETGGSTWLYKPAHHKTAWRGKARTIAIGPKAQQVLLEFFTTNIDDFLFSPSRAVHELNSELSANRVTPRYPSHMKQNANKRKENPLLRPAAVYDVNSYGHAIDRACDRAFPPTGDLAQREGETHAAWWGKWLGKGQSKKWIEGRLTPSQRSEDKAWRKAHRWHPNQLRHTFATRVRKQHGLEAAQVLLGHSRADVTQVYAERNEELAATVAAKIG